MADVGYPIVEKIPYNSDTPATLDDAIQGDKTKRKLLIDYPTIYVIYSPEKSGGYKVYVGETNDIERRTEQHLNEDPKVRTDWKELSRSKNAEIFVIGHNHFNKSLTLDIENQMMLYMLGVPSVKRLNNRRENEQNEYYTSNEKEQIFSRIWGKLRKYNNDLFPVESVIRDSAIFKASPFHNLTAEQKNARDVIIDRIIDALLAKKTGQLILVEGEAGSGKTVLLSTIFYLIGTLTDDGSPLRRGFDNLNNYILVNHDEQLKVYEDITRKLDLNHKNKDMVSKPTRFINNHSEDSLADVVLVDEAHLLWTQGKQAYRGQNQLDDILKRSRITVAIFDKNQMLKTEEYLETEQIAKIEDKARKQNNLIMLSNQLRIHANAKTIEWIRNITDKKIIQRIPKDKNYDLRIFDDAQEMYEAIRDKAKDEQYGLSRVLATFDWKYNSKRKPDNGDYWMVTAGDLSLPWNLQLKPKCTRSIKRLAWAEQPQTINEVGSTYTIQGFDLNYSGVIIGPSVKYRNGHVVFDPSESENTNAIRNRTLENGKKAKVSDRLLPNELNILLTRGVNGLYIYAVDDELRDVLLKSQ